MRVKERPPYSETKKKNATSVVSSVTPSRNLRTKAGTVRNVDMCCISYNTQKSHPLITRNSQTFLFLKKFPNVFVFRFRQKRDSSSANAGFGASADRFSRRYHVARKQFFRVRGRMLRYVEVRNFVFFWVPSLEKRFEKRNLKMNNPIV